MDEDIHDPAWEPTLTQLEILHRLALGRQSRLVARDLSISEATLRRHLRSAKVALGAESTIEAVYLACKRGLI